MNGGQLPTNQLHDIKLNWGALDHASHAPHAITIHVHCMQTQSRMYTCTFPSLVWVHDPHMCTRKAGLF